MKINPSFLPSSPRRVVASALALLALLALATPSAEAGASGRRALREYGYTGSYTGIVRGIESFRTLSTSPFTTLPVSRLGTEKMPQPERQRIASPFGAGNTYLLYVKINANKRRATLRGLYYGEAFNPALGLTTVRTGSKKLDVRRNSHSGAVTSMSLDDRMSEFAAATGALHAQWALKGALDK